jgi:hypothetical protein
MVFRNMFKTLNLKFESVVVIELFEICEGGKKDHVNAEKVHLINSKSEFNYNDSFGF